LESAELIFQFFEGSDLLNQLFSATAGAEDFEVSSASDEDKFKTLSRSLEDLSQHKRECGCQHQQLYVTCDVFAIWTGSHAEELYVPTSPSKSWPSKLGKPQL
jgi:hypothetical protein